MAKLVPGQTAVLARAPHWSDKGTYWRKLHNPLKNGTPGQNAAQAQFARAASEAFGDTGFIAGQPAVAYHVRATLSGSETASKYGESSEQRAARVRNESHTAAPRVAEALQRMAERKAAARRGQASYAGARGLGGIMGGRGIY